MAEAQPNILNSLEDCAGLISFASLITLLLLDAWKVSFSYRSLVQLMIYFDCVAFVFKYYAQFIDYKLKGENIPAMWLLFTAECLWLFKDVCKNSYIVWRTMFVANVSKNPNGNGHIHIGVWFFGGLSAALYSWYLVANYSWLFAGIKKPEAAPSNLPVVTLYMYWTILDIVCTSFLIQTIRKYSAFEKASNVQSKLPLSRVVQREIFRVIVTAGLSAVVSFFTILRVTSVGTQWWQQFPFRALFFAISQHVLLLSVMRYTQAASEESAHSPPQGQISP